MGMDFSQIAASLADTPEGTDLPVDKWHPDHCGEMDLTIRSDGTWVHEGAPIGRAALVRLLSRVLRKDPEGYVLVTPAEKLSITVEDVPFLVVDFDRIEDGLCIRTNVGDQVMIGPDHPLDIHEPAEGGKVPLPYVQIRGDLWARFARASYYRLIEEESWVKENSLVVESGGETYNLGALE